MMRNVLRLLRPAVSPWVAVAAMAVGLGIGPGLATAKESNAALQEGTVGVAQLPPQGQKTYELIAQGGPFPYDKDGTVFGNRERLLPAQKRGYYREYTVKTPYARNRGAKRIVCGGLAPSSPDVCYYTEDHYESFRRIVR